MEPKYSIIICGQDLGKYKSKIDSWLHNGIKVIWFGNDYEMQDLKAEFKPFCSAFLLQVFVLKCEVSGIYMDGEIDDETLHSLAINNSEFNVDQYKVEHCRSDRHVIVEASAGTGKTTVMIDRILYLLHMVLDLKMEDVFMVTFTNDATNQMNERLQERLMQRYKLTRMPKYLKWLEEQSQMNISTIHSFAYRLIGEYGIDEGFTRNLSVAGLSYERKEIIKDILNHEIDPGKSIWSQANMSYYKLTSVVDEFWRKIAQLGITTSDMQLMDWGKGVDKNSEKLNKLIQPAIEGIDEDYLGIKRTMDALALEDIMRDLQYIFSSKLLPKTDLRIRYLFVDEFQDSDDSQIQVLTDLVKMLNCKLFVVGDIKQSIYRFRGATDIAFLRLKKLLEDASEPEPLEFVLVNNYRTSANVLNRLDKYFRQWGKEKLLSYDKAVIPLNKQEGVIRMFQSYNAAFDENEFVDNVNELLDDLANRIEAKETKLDGKAKVVALVRTNRQLIDLAKICKLHRIPVAVKMDGNFYTSDAVRDFLAMISSYLFYDEPKYLFNYLLTPYASTKTSLDLHFIEQLEGDKKKIKENLDAFLSQTDWEYYHKEFRLRPVMAVIMEMVSNGNITQHYIENSKQQKYDKEWTEERCIASTFTEAKQYDANLKKLLQILQRFAMEENTSLYDIYKYLSIQMRTNREEQEASIEDETDYKTLYCMTIHKSKGLEFDSVILPMTSKSFFGISRSEILINKDEQKVGWFYLDRKKNIEMCNEYYDEMRREEDGFIMQEETRLLYVAMTRCIHSLVCMTTCRNTTNSWEELIKEVGVDNE